MFYAGIGSRQTPDHILELMTKLSLKLRELGFIVRSGGAEGADTSFTKETSPDCEIYLPGLVSEDAMVMASKYHPVWDRLSEWTRKLHARNCYQVLGEDLNTPSMFVVCWTSDGAETHTSRDTGGTGQAIRVAIAHGIPVFNMKNPDALLRLKAFLIEKGVLQ